MKSRKLISCLLVTISIILITTTSIFAASVPLSLGSSGVSYSYQGSAYCAKAYIDLKKTTSNATYAKTYTRYLATPGVSGAQVTLSSSYYLTVSGGWLEFGNNWVFGNCNVWDSNNNSSILSWSS